MRKAIKRLFTVAALLIIAAFVAFLVPKVMREYIYPMKYSGYVSESAKKNNFDEYMVYAVIKTESGFNPEAESDVGARGLMQLMNDAYEWVKYRMNDERDITYDDMFNPQYNIEYGTYMLSILYDEYGDYETALAAYHSGRGQVNKWLENPEYSSNGKTLDEIPSTATAHYVSKVMNNYRIYTELYI